MNRVDGSISHAVTERLSNVESLLEEHSKLLHDLRSRLDQSTGMSILSANSPGSNLSFPIDAVSLTSDVGVPIEHIHFLIPQQHRTSTNWLLSLPKIRDFLGKYPSDYFHEVEVNNPLPPELSYSNRNFANVYNLQPHEAEPLIERYFTCTNFFYPVISQEELVHYHTTTEGDPIVSALVLLVCALGALNYPEPSKAESNALQYFASAMQIINDQLAWSFKHSTRLAQALVLAASFLAHMGRPLHSWRCVQEAFSTLQQSLPRATTGPVSTPDRIQQRALQSLDESQRRVFWACFLIEWYVFSLFLSFSLFFSLIFLLNLYFFLQ
jgi:hypothetical protein